MKSMKKKGMPHIQKILDRFFLKSFVLTGGAGFVGSYVVEELLKQNISLHLLVRKNTLLERLNQEK